MYTNLDSAFDRMAICSPSTIYSGPSYTNEGLLAGPPIKLIGTTNAGVQRRDNAYIAAEEVEHELPPSFSMRKYTIAIYKTDSRSSATISPASESTQGASGTLQSFVQNTYFPAITELELLFHDPTNLAACDCNDAAFFRHIRSSSWWPDQDALGDAMYLCRSVGERLRKVTIHMCIPEYVAYPTYGLKCLVRRYCPNVKEVTIPHAKHIKLSNLNAEASLVRYKGFAG
ncbi:hypothetical protein V8D89_005090 [Ganoderma adspersum]